jgi:hypothetical protein
MQYGFSAIGSLAIPQTWRNLTIIHVAVIRLSLGTEIEIGPANFFARHDFGWFAIGDSDRRLGLNLGCFRHFFEQVKRV